MSFEYLSEWDPDLMPWLPAHIVDFRLVNNVSRSLKKSWFSYQLLWSITHSVWDRYFKKIDMNWQPSKLQPIIMEKSHFLNACFHSWLIHPIDLTILIVSITCVKGIRYFWRNAGNRQHATYSFNIKIQCDYSSTM